MTRDATIGDWLPVIKGEFKEIPGLVLTKPQFCRLWGLDAQTCDRVIDVLLSSSFLKKTPRDMYALAT